MSIEAFGAYLKETKSPNTARAYGRDLDDFVTWFQQTSGSQFEPAAVTSLDVREYRRALQNRRASAATINRRLAALTSYFRWAVEQGQVPDNPAAGVSGMGAVKLAPKWLERTEQNGLVRQARKKGSLRDMAIVVLLLNTGLRVSELCDLEMGDIKISDRKGSVHVRAGKGQKDRSVPLNGEAREAMENYLATLPASWRDNPRQQIWRNQRGESLTPAGVQNLVREYARRAKLPGCTPHTLRHSFGKNLVDAGVPLDQVAALLGHENLNTTRIYTAPSLNDLTEAVEKIGG